MVESHHRMAVHESFRLHITTEKFYIEPTDEVINELLVIDRVSQEILLQKNEDQIPSHAETKVIYGIVGIIRLLAGPYLVVITKRLKVGEIDNQVIWKVTGTEVLSYKKTLFHLTDKQNTDNSRYLSMVEHVLSMQSYFYSTTYDMTHTLQRLNNTSPDFQQMPLHERADTRFVWNGHLLRELAQQQELSRYCLPILLGFVSISHVSVSQQSFSYVLISRRCCFRAGTRYNIRGVDSEGHAANYVETEQIVEYGDIKCSFVQTRGSIPLIWSQYPNLKYKPDPVIYSQADQSKKRLGSFNRHFAAQIFNYGHQVIINLLDQKGQEIGLVNAFNQTIKGANNPNIKYEPFDFHHECRKMRWHRLSLLTDRIAEDLKRFGFFMISKDGRGGLQEGVFRTNCIDCLDRTNVVQSLLAKKSLQAQLEELGILTVGQQVEDDLKFETLFKNVWADNADACAKQYAGTGALKTDFTRTGKRTRLGMLKDGYNSAVRYFMNNFYDGFRQDAIDLFLGNYIIEESEGLTKTSPLQLDRDWKFYALPAIFIVAFSMLVISILIPDEHLSEQTMYILFWGGASIITMGVMYYFGDEFVDRPKLAWAKAKME